VKKRASFGALLAAVGALALIAAGCGGGSDNSSGTGGGGGGSVKALPASSCGPLQYEGDGNPDYLIATDLPMQGGSRTQTLQMVGAIKYLLDKKNWKAALSRYESAVVLDPENPEVYWGMGEAQRHLGKLAEAKAAYEKLVEYDPDSKHGKEARKILSTPEMANAPTAAAKQP